MRSQVAFSSDAMDYGMPTADWYAQALNAHFTIKSKTPKVLQKLGVGVFKKNGIIGALSKANSAFYGKDYTRDKQWTMEERKSLSEGVTKESEDHLRTMTPRIARLLHGIDYSDNILRKLDTTKLNALFAIHHANRKKYDALKNPLGRSWMSVITPKYINKVLNKS